MASAQKEYIALNGDKFTIEWYFNSKGESMALDYFESLKYEEQVKIFGLMQLMANVGHIKKQD